MKAKYLFIAIAAIVLCSCERSAGTFFEKLYIENRDIDQYVAGQHDNCDSVIVSFDGERKVCVNLSESKSISINKYHKNPVDVSVVMYQDGNVVRTTGFSGYTFEQYRNYQLIVRGYKNSIALETIY